MSSRKCDNLDAFDERTCLCCRAIREFVIWNREVIFGISLARKIVADLCLVFIANSPRRFPLDDRTHRRTFASLLFGFYSDTTSRIELGWRRQRIASSFGPGLFPMTVHEVLTRFLSLRRKITFFMHDSKRPYVLRPFLFNYQRNATCGRWRLAGFRLAKKARIVVL